MRILFVHQNFPGQFLHLAPALKEKGHEVHVLTAQENQRSFPFGNMRYKYKPPEVGGLTRSFIVNAERGATVARVASVMRARHNYVPDVIFGHYGWGETMFLKEVWPEARLLSYAEFFYRPEGLDAGFDPEFSKLDLDRRLRLVAQQPHLRHALGVANAVIAPTVWQASMLPREYRDKLSVVHDGINTEKLTPDPQASFQVPDSTLTLTAGDEVLTFVNRNLEPHRGYHIFMRALPAVLAARPNAQVVIVGADQRGYGAVPADGRSWKEIFLSEVADRIDQSRVHFTGRLPYESYCNLMRVSRVHAYLSYPFVLSWSMLEAMSMGAHVVGSRTAPVQEVITHGENGQLVNFFDVDGWSNTLIDGLANPAAHDGLRAAARRTVIDRYDLKTKCLPRMIEFVETAGT